MKMPKGYKRLEEWIHAIEATYDPACGPDDRIRAGLDLMKEMAEALELISKEPLHGPMSDLANKAVYQIAAESVLIKFKEWK